MSVEGAVALQHKYGSTTTMLGVPDQRKVAKEAWYRPIKQRYNPDFKRWDAEYHRDMDIWAKILREAR